MGFSLAGLLLGAFILAPSLLLIPYPPREGVAAIKDAGPAFTILERAGQVGCLLLLATLPGPSLNLWFWFAVIAVFLYYLLWWRYLSRGRHARDLFAPVVIPVPMAVLPVVAFGLAAVWGWSPWLALAAGVLAVGHITNSVAAWRALR